MYAVILWDGVGALRVEIKSGLAFIAPPLSGPFVADLVLLTILAGFFLIRVREFADGVELLDLLDRGLITVVDPTTPARSIGVLCLLFACSGIAGSRCASKT